PRRRLDPSLAHLERVLALKHVESFIERVLVEERSTRVTGRSEALVNGQRTRGVFGAYLYPAASAGRRPNRGSTTGVKDNEALSVHRSVLLRPADDSLFDSLAEGTSTSS